MTINRMAIAAIVDRLIYGDEHTFGYTDAVQLDNLIPKTDPPAWWRRIISYRVSGRISGGQTKGYAAGVGNVSLPKADREFDYDSLGREMIRAGQWKIFRDGRHIRIEQMASDGPMSPAALLKFNRDRLPQRMDRMEYFGYVVMVGRFRPWKNPCLPEGNIYEKSSYPAHN